MRNVLKNIKKRGVRRKFEALAKRESSIIDILSFGAMVIRIDQSIHRTARHATDLKAKNILKKPNIE